MNSNWLKSGNRSRAAIVAALLATSEALKPDSGSWQRVPSVPTVPAEVPIKRSSPVNQNLPAGVSQKTSLEDVWQEMSDVKQAMMQPLALPSAVHRDNLQAKWKELDLAELGDERDEQSKLYQNFKLLYQNYKTPTFTAALDKIKAMMTWNPPNSVTVYRNQHMFTCYEEAALSAILSVLLDPSDPLYEPIRKVLLLDFHAKYGVVGGGSALPPMRDLLNKVKPDGLQVDTIWDHELQLKKGEPASGEEVAKFHEQFKNKNIQAITGDTRFNELFSTGAAVPDHAMLVDSVKEDRVIFHNSMGNFHSPQVDRDIARVAKLHAVYFEKDFVKPEHWARDTRTKLVQRAKSIVQGWAVPTGNHVEFRTFIRDVCFIHKVHAEKVPAVVHVMDWFKQRLPKVNPNAGESYASDAVAWQQLGIRNLGICKFGFGKTSETNGANHGVRASEAKVVQPFQPVSVHDADADALKAFFLQAAEATATVSFSQQGGAQKQFSVHPSFVEWIKDPVEHHTKLAAMTMLTADEALKELLVLPIQKLLDFRDSDGFNIFNWASRSPELISGLLEHFQKNATPETIKTLVSSVVRESKYKFCLAHATRKGHFAAATQLLKYTRGKVLLEEDHPIGKDVERLRTTWKATLEQNQLKQPSLPREERSAELNRELNDLNEFSEELNQKMFDSMQAVAGFKFYRLKESGSRVELKFQDNRDGGKRFEEQIKKMEMMDRVLDAMFDEFKSIFDEKFRQSVVDAAENENVRIPRLREEFGDVQHFADRLIATLRRDGSDIYSTRYPLKAKLQGHGVSDEFIDVFCKTFTSLLGGQSEETSIVSMEYSKMLNA